MNGAKRVSIITVTLNSEKTIRQTIESVLNQTYNNIEYIIIDGGSTDGTKNIIGEYLDRIDYYVSEKDNGIYDAFNKGIRASSGDIIGIINSDDYYTLDAVEIAVDVLCANDADLCCGNMIVLENELVKGIVKSDITNNQWCGSKINHPTVFALKRAYKTVGLYDASYKIASDYKWLLEGRIKKLRIVYIDKELVFFRRGGVSTNKKSILQAFIESYHVVRDLFVKFEIGNDDWNYVYEYWRDRIYRLMTDDLLESTPTKVADVLKHFVKNKSAVIWGCGYYGKKIITICDNHGINVPYVIDSNEEKLNNQFLGRCIKCPEELAIHECSIIMAIDKQKEELLRYSDLYGINKDRIITLYDIRHELCKGVL